MADADAGLWQHYASRLATFRRLRWRERGLFLEAALLISVVSVSLKVLSLQRVQNILGVGAPNVGPSLYGRPDVVKRAVAAAHVVDLASRYTLVANTCLHRSLALWWLLKRRGLPSQVQFGARKTATGDFEAHAWVKCEDQVLNDNQGVERDYTPLSWPAKHDA
jgi:hypothetical protein